jgi:glycosyltransferase involved in cell wall biosynthesis
LLYLAMAQPVVCSPVAMNREVIQDRVNGLLASTTKEWLAALESLIEDGVKRAELGEAGRRTVEERYALSVLAPRLCQLLTAVCSGEQNQARMAEECA